MYKYVALGTGFAIGFFRVVALIALTLIALQFTANIFGFGVDNSDISAWKRSGMKIHTDALTGRQYLSSRGGGLYPRIGIDGEQIIVEVEDD